LVTLGSGAGLRDKDLTYEVTVPSEYQVLSWPKIPRAGPSSEAAASVCRVWPAENKFD